MLCVKLLTNTESSWAPRIWGWNRGDQSNPIGKHSTPELWHSQLFHWFCLQTQTTEMQVWLWRSQAALVLCFKGHCYKPDQRQTWNPCYLWTAGPKLLKQLGVFRLSSAELWERSLAISWGQAILMDVEAEQAQQHTARPGLDAFSQLCPWLHWSQRGWAEHCSDCSGTKRAILHWKLL